MTTSNRASGDLLFAKPDITAAGSATSGDLKPTAEKALDALFKNYSEADVRKYFSPSYIQHSPSAPTGIEPVIDLLPVLKKNGTTSRTHRMLQDGDLILMHNTYHNAEIFGAHDVVAFDIWRFQDGKVAEHWDAINPVAKKTASGRSQVDGPVEITDINKTADNKLLVINLIKQVHMGGNLEGIDDFISATEYHQHNLGVKDGLSELQDALRSLVSANNMFKYTKIHKVIGEGNFVLIQSEGVWKGKSQAFYDLFRVQDDKIVEHWDVIQEIPAKSANNNTMF